MPVKQNLKEHFEDGKLDLSMLGLTEVPVKDIAAIPKATSLDLSNNSLATIGKNFPTSLSHLVYLDLARNHLTELPENIGLLVNVKHLDLYSNQLTSLPLSFGNLKALRWLDLKQNPLLPKLAQIAGPCLDSSQCASAAKNVVELLAMMHKQVEVEKQRRQEQRKKQLEENERKAQEQKKEQQMLKKKSKKSSKEANEDAKLSSPMGNGDMNNHGDENGGENLVEHDNDSNKELSPDSHDEIKAVVREHPNRVYRFIGTVFKIIVITSLFLALSLFVLNLLDEDSYNLARRNLIKVRNHVTGMFPRSFTSKVSRLYLSGRKSFWRYTNRLGKMGLAMMQNLQEMYTWVNTDETVQFYFEQLKSGWQVLWIRISEIYRTIMVKAN